MPVNLIKRTPKDYVNIALTIELILLFICLPIGMYFFRQAIAPFLLLFLITIVAWCLLLLLSDPRFKRFRLWNKREFHASFKYVLLNFLLAAAGMTIASWYITPEWLFILPLEHTLVWLLLLVLYPLLSAWPQELIFRTFFFHRYKKIVKSKTLRAYLSATSFALAHLLFANWIAVVGSFIAGLVFSFTYIRSRSTLLVAVEHSLWGCWLFTTGLGMHFDSTKQLYQ